MRAVTIFAASILVSAGPTGAQQSALDQRFQPMDVFGLEWASDPQISPDGLNIVYMRNFMDIKADRRRSNLWLVSADGTMHRALTSGMRSDGSPRWSPDGRRLLYTAATDGGAQLFVRWTDTGETAQLTQLPKSPAGLTWAQDGRSIAFTMFVPEKATPLAELPPAPEGASWAPRPRVVDLVGYRADGAGYREHGHTQLFVLPADGGSPRQLTSGPYDHAAPAWTPDGKHILIQANRRADAEYEPLDSEIYEVAVSDGAIRALTDRRGPDSNPIVSPDGRRVAYTGFDDRYQGYQVTRLYVMDRDGGNARAVSAVFDRDIETPRWSADGRGLFFKYDDHGETKLAWIALDGAVSDIASGLGGTSIDRPYGGAAFSIGPNGRFAATVTTPQRPADIAIGSRNTALKQVTSLNNDLLAHRKLGSLEEIRYRSSHDGREIQGWILRPPDFDPQRKYPLILEIHGGPFQNYGPRFAADFQLYAARDYVVLYTNPRGSTSYGGEFGNLIHHAYPGDDYFDLMSGVDAVIAKGYIDPEQLFITGGSGGGVLTSWSIGRTTRFRAAVVQKPVINWYSFVLTADAYPFFSRYWFPGPPWENVEHYHARSPISLVGNVRTPTMLISGESDYRTPISESEQYYQALRLRKIDAALVRIPEASHSIDTRPSNLIAKVQYVLGWFEKYRTAPRAQ